MVRTSCITANRALSDDALSIELSLVNQREAKSTRGSFDSSCGLPLKINECKLKRWRCNKTGVREGVLIKVLPGSVEIIGKRHLDLGASLASSLQRSRVAKDARCHTFGSFRGDPGTLCSYGHWSESIRAGSWTNIYSLEHVARITAPVNYDLFANLYVQFSSSRLKIFMPHLLWLTIVHQLYLPSTIVHHCQCSMFQQSGAVSSLDIRDQKLEDKKNLATLVSDVNKERQLEWVDWSLRKINKFLQKLLGEHLLLLFKRSSVGCSATITMPATPCSNNDWWLMKNVEFEAPSENRFCCHQICAVPRSSVWLGCIWMM